MQPPDNETHHPAGGSCSRRVFLRSLAALPLLATVPYQDAEAAIQSTRRLAFHHLHTGESLDIVYRKGKNYSSTGLARISRVLRDHHNGRYHPIDPKLLDLLFDMRSKLRTKGPFLVVCGYRSPETNALLHAQCDGVATNSLHMQGRAIDIRLQDVATRRVRDAAERLERGGVGYYRSSDFVHVDTGEFRTW